MAYFLAFTLTFVHRFAAHFTAWFTVEVASTRPEVSGTTTAAIGSTAQAVWTWAILHTSIAFLCAGNRTVATVIFSARMPLTWMPSLSRRLISDNRGVILTQSGWNRANS